MIEFIMQTKNQKEMEHLKGKKRIEVKNSLGGINRLVIIGEISKLQDKAEEISQKVTGRQSDRRYKVKKENQFLTYIYKAVYCHPAYLTYMQITS